MVKKSKVKTQVKSEREIETIKKENTPPPSQNEDESNVKDSSVKKRVKAENRGAPEQPMDLSYEENQTPKVENNENIKVDEEVSSKSKNLNGSKGVKVESLLAKEEKKVTPRGRKRSSDTEEESPARSRSATPSSDSRSSSPASFRSGSGSYSSPQIRDRKKRIRNTDSEPSSNSDDDQVSYIFFHLTIGWRVGGEESEFQDFIEILRFLRYFQADMKGF